MRFPARTRCVSQASNNYIFIGHLLPENGKHFNQIASWRERVPRECVCVCLLCVGTCPQKVFKDLWPSTNLCTLRGPGNQLRIQSRREWRRIEPARHGHRTAFRTVCRANNQFHNLPRKCAVIQYNCGWVRHIFKWSKMTANKWINKSRC